MTPSEVITEVRRLIQDSKIPFRYSDAILLGFVNQTLKRMLMLRPDLFSTVAEFTTVPGVIIQSCPADGTRLVDIFQVKNGNVVTEVDRETLDRSVPHWPNAPSGQPVNFMRHVKNPNKFFLYPPPAANVVLIGEYAKTPPKYELTETILAPTDAYFPALVDGVVYLAESIDNEHVNSNRAKLFQDSFIQELGTNLQSRVMTDTPNAGMSPDEVI